MNKTFYKSVDQPHASAFPGTESSVLHCPVCAGTFRVALRNVQDATTKIRFEIHRCASCDLGMTLPQPSELGRYYQNYYGARHGLSAGFRAGRRLALVRKLTGQTGGRLLDIGCGDGCFLAAARNVGFQVVGTERNPEPARRRGLEIVEDLHELSDADGFDFITLWHSLEHMNDPRSVLKRARMLLQKGGYLIVAVPDSGGLQARLFGRHWLHLDVPRHLYHFNMKSLSRLFMEDSLQISETWHQEFEYDLMGWSQSVLNALGMEQNAFLHLLMGRDAVAGFRRKAIIAALGLVGSVAFLPLVFLGSVARSGGTLIAAAQPGSMTS